jgi:hypothetical protein
MAGQSRANGPRPKWASLLRPWLVPGRGVLRPPASGPDGPPENGPFVRLLDQRAAAGRRQASGRDDDAAWIRDDRVDKLDLHSDDRPQPCLAGGVREPDDAVEALVIRDRKTAQAQLERAIDQLIGR